MTTIVCVTLLDDVAFDAVSVIVYVPAVLYAWSGRCSFDPVPSPKLHDHDEGEPVVVSSKPKYCPAIGLTGCHPNPATDTL